MPRVIATSVHKRAKAQQNFHFFSVSRWNPREMGLSPCLSCAGQNNLGAPSVLFSSFDVTAKSPLNRVSEQLTAPRSTLLFCIGAKGSVCRKQAS